MLNSQSTQPIFRLLAWLFGLRSIVSGSAPARLGSAARNIQRFHFPAFAGGMRFDDAGGRIAARIMANDARPGVSLSSVFDNIPLTALALEQGHYDWGALAYAVGFG